MIFLSRARGLVAAATLLIGVGAWLGCQRSAPVAVKTEAALEPTPGLPWFEELTARAGIRFNHFNNATRKHYPLEVMGSGIAWLDFDQDGLYDLFCVQTDTFRRLAPGAAATHKLYRNLGEGRFADVTEETHLNRSGIGCGCAVGDYDNDGFDDLFVSYFGGVALFHNEPNGKGGRKFVERAKEAGLTNPHWGTSCGWGDTDNDGLLDLYLCNYFVLDLDKYVPCLNKDVNKFFTCPPSTYDYVHHKLFRNKGDGAFEDISERSGIARVPAAPGLAVILIDLDDDGLLDIYAANDMKPQYLFHNQGGGRFEEKGMRVGAAMQMNGRLIAGMCAEAGDIDGSGRPSLFITNFQNDPNMLFLNKGKLFFEEWSYLSGLGAPSMSRLGFGAAMIDIDLDGHLDVAVANGHIDRHSREILGAPFEQEAQLFLGDGKAKFRDVSAKAGPYFVTKNVGRGLAWADFNNDGLPDLAFSHNAGPIALLENKTKNDNHWLRLELEGDGKKSNRNAIGAKIVIEAGGRKLTRWIHGGGSYQSACERRLIVGLADATKAERVTIRWPSGQVQVVADLAASAGYHIREGQAPEKRR